MLNHKMTQFFQNGYKLKLNYVKNCDDESVVKIGKDFDVTLDKDCNIMISGCLNFTKTITTAKVTFLTFILINKTQGLILITN